MNANQFRGWMIIFLILIAVIGFTTNSYNPKHSIYREDQFGASVLRETLEENTDKEISRLLISPFGISEEQQNSTIIIIGSERAYTQAEIDAYEEFVAQGGNLIIFEDFGYARAISERMGISFFEGTLRERNENLMVNRPSQFLVKDLFAEYFGVVSPLLLVNEAAAIIDLGGFASGESLPFLITQNSTYLDIDNDNVVDSGDRASNFGFPIGILKTYEKGNLVVISDSSLPLNIHHERTIDIQDTIYPLPNVLYSSFLIQTVSELGNTPSIIFDESHQEIILSSGVGLINLVTSTWVGIFNSLNLIAALFGATIVVALFVNRDFYRQMVGKFRSYRESNVTANQFVSNPTLAERGLSEQYILYQRMGTEFIHIANIELYDQIQKLGKSKEFLEEFNEKYGAVDTRRSAVKLLEMHHQMRNHIANELIKWL